MLVSPGAATEGVTYFFLQKLMIFLVIALCKVTTFL